MQKDTLKLLLKFLLFNIKTTCFIKRNLYSFENLKDLYLAQK